MSNHSFNTSCIRQLFEAARTARRNINYYLGPIGIDESEYLVLEHLREAPGARATDITRRSYFGTNVAYTLKKMQEKGLIEKDEGDYDRRERYFELTEKGKAVLTEAEDLLESAPFSDYVPQKVAQAFDKNDI